MRLIRVVALFGSLMLLVATLVSLFNSRTALYEERDARVSAAAATATGAVETMLLRARAVVEVASSDSAPEDLLRTFGEESAACVGSRCTDSDIAALPGFGAAVAAAQSADSVVMVEASSQSVVVVAQRDDTTIAIQLLIEAMFGQQADESSVEAATEVMVDTSRPDLLAAASGIESIDGERVIVAQIGEPLDDGSIIVRTSVPDGVGWGADSPTLYGLLLGLGTVLLALAGWTFLVERRQLERRATTDELTGLVNRREFERQSEEAIEMAGRLNAGLCIMLIDLNGFKQVNDTLGHQFGDLVLKECAVRLVDAVRDTDLVGRWGGDEFVVLLPGLEESTAVRRSAERLGASMSSTPIAGDVSMSGSIGAALYPRHGATLAHLMQAADVAMYEAKTTGVVHRVASSVAADNVLRPPSYGGPDRRRSSPQPDDVVAH